MINKISVIDYLKYLEIIYKNEEKEEKAEEEEEKEKGEEKEKEDDASQVTISKNEKKYIKKKKFKGEQPYIELCLDNKNLVANIETLVLAFIELNDKTKEERFYKKIIYIFDKTF